MCVLIKLTSNELSLVNDGILCEPVRLAVAAAW